MTQAARRRAVTLTHMAHPCSDTDTAPIPKRAFSPLFTPNNGMNFAAMTRM